MFFYPYYTLLSPDVNTPCQKFFMGRLGVEKVPEIELSDGERTAFRRPARTPKEVADSLEL